MRQTLEFWNLPDKVTRYPGETGAVASQRKEGKPHFAFEVLNSCYVDGFYGFAIVLKTACFARYISVALFFTHGKSSLMRHRE